MRYLTGLVLAIIVAVVAGCGTSHTEHVQHLQKAAVEGCHASGAKATRANVVVRDGKVHALRAGRPFVSHAMGGCAGTRANSKNGPPRLEHGELGCDLSNNDPVFNFAPIRANGLTYCWLKDIEGTNFHDRTAAGMRSAADGAGVQVGGYDFGHVCLVSASGEAHFFALELRADGLVGLNRLVPVLDAEYAGNGCNVGQWVRDWIAQMHNDGFASVGIYAGCFWWSPRLGRYWPDPHIMAWIPGYPNPPNCVNHAITVHQFTDAGNLGGGARGDENRLLGQPSEILNGPPPVVVPPKVMAMNDRIKVLWGRRDAGRIHSFGLRDLDYQLNRIYQNGWSPHLSGPKHDWTGKQTVPSQWAKDDCAKVVARWAKGRHGLYVQTLLRNMWGGDHGEHDRCHPWGDHGAGVVVRFPGNVNPPGSPH